MSEVVVTSLSNLRNEVRYGAGHSFITDEPIAAGGEDHVYANAGPVPTSIDVVAYRGKREPIIQSRANARAGSAS